MIEVNRYGLKCLICEAPLPSFVDRRRKFCSACGYKRTSKASRRWQEDSPKARGHKSIRRITATAVRAGFLKDPTTMNCVDCGSAAHCYDHRDYNKPLDVEPVCLTCNARRGPGVAFAEPAPSEAA